MFNALTIDVEDWYHSCFRESQASVPVEKRRVRQNTERILDLLTEYDVKATFFMLGSVAQEEPTLVASIVAAGHEIASHGYSHTLTPLLGPKLFQEEIHRTAAIIGYQSGCCPAGFRAPQWSLSRDTGWALDILKKEGYEYDSSFNPLPFVGDSRGQLIPFEIMTRNGPILEIPPLVTPFPLTNLPTGGGWGFRFFPLALIERTVKSLNAAGRPAVFYLHPREMEAFGPRLKLSPWKSFAAYGTRTDAAARLRHLLQKFRFRPLRELVKTWKNA
ncbi:MAG TPA: polysaccharide deacetylase family protein [Desulfuromonadaceae bacterium]